jgi:hypothetical protein
VQSERMSRRPERIQGEILSSEQRHLLRGWAYGWAHAAELSAGRVQPSSQRTMADRQADAMLFVLALSKMEMCAVALLGDPHAEVARFRSTVPRLKDVRDMLEHLDEYVTGQGRLQLRAEVPFRVRFRDDHETLTITVLGIAVRVADAFDAGLRLLRVAFGGQPDDDDARPDDV